MNIDAFDFAVSFSATSSSDVDTIVDRFGAVYYIYDYRSFLVDQLGMVVDDVAMSVYGRVPVIILMTSDWWVRPATKLECGYICNNPASKLIFDYSGANGAKIIESGIYNFEFGEFTHDGNISLESVRLFLRRIFGDISR